MKTQLLMALILLSVISAFAPQEAFAQDEFEKVEVLDFPRFSLTKRFTLDLDLTFLPLDAYYKPLLIDVAGSYQFNDWFTLEALRFGVSLLEHDTGLASAIQTETREAGAEFIVSPEDQRLREMQWRIGSAGMFNLLYSKSNWFNSSIVYHYWQAGAGMTYWGLDSKNQISLDLIVRARFFLNDTFTINIRGAHSIGFKSDAPQNITQLGVGTGIAF